MSDIIPSELVREILLRLPGKSLLRLRCLCKEWRSVIDDPSFIRSHTNIQLSSPTLLIKCHFDQFYYLPSLDSLNFTDQIQTMDATPIPCGMLEESMVLVPCNGLILMFVEKRGTPCWLITNMLTRKCHDLPLPPLVADKRDYFYGEYRFGDYFYGGYGFGYDYAADDYKVVCIDRRWRTRIYSLKSESWRIIGDFPYHDCSGADDDYFYGAGVFLNGAFHWLSSHRIVVLNLGTEDYRLLSLPPKLTASKVHLAALGGHLLCFDGNKNWHDRRCEGWVMNDYGVESSWTMLFSAALPDTTPAWKTSRMVAYLKREKHVLLQNGKRFIWVDIESPSAKQVFVNGVSPPRIGFAHLCTESLYPLAAQWRAGTVAANKTAETK